MLHFFIVRLGLTELSDALLKNQINFVLIADYNGGKPKIFRKTFYYESIHEKHVGKMGCRDEKTIFFFNCILAIM